MELKMQPEKVKILRCKFDPQIKVTLRLNPKHKIPLSLTVYDSTLNLRSYLTPSESELSDKTLFYLYQDKLTEWITSSYDLEILPIPLTFTLLRAFYLQADSERKDLYQQRIIEALKEKSLEYFEYIATTGHILALSVSQLENLYFDREFLFKLKTLWTASDKTHSNAAWYVLMHSKAKGIGFCIRYIHHIFRNASFAELEHIFRYLTTWYDEKYVKERLSSIRNELYKAIKPTKDMNDLSKAEDSAREFLTKLLIKQ